MGKTGSCYEYKCIRGFSLVLIHERERSEGVDRYRRSGGAAARRRRIVDGVLPLTAPREDDLAKKNAGGTSRRHQLPLAIGQG